MNSFYTPEELYCLGLAGVGNNVMISKKASIYSPENITVGNNVRIDDFCILSGKIQIGNYVHIAAYSALYGGDKGIFINDFANLSSRISVYAISDDFSGASLTSPMIPDKYKKLISLRVNIGRNVVIGSGCVVLPGANIEDGVAVGALSLVNTNLPKLKICCGIPAKPIKNRKDEFLILEKEFLEEKENEQNQCNKIVTSSL